ncbi:MAG: hypothetical protein EA377_13815 [Phycisphaerales bacterium]|nr:MAG: hypothetical protein EA377_13815 [Phycisphaerales bacterium]
MISDEPVAARTIEPRSTASAHPTVKQSTQLPAVCGGTPSSAPTEWKIESRASLVNVGRWLPAPTE